jgi:hypothetical protein
VVVVSSATETDSVLSGHHEGYFRADFLLVAQELRECGALPV